MEKYRLSCKAIQFPSVRVEKNSTSDSCIEIRQTLRTHKFESSAERKEPRHSHFLFFVALEAEKRRHRMKI